MMVKEMVICSCGAEMYEYPEAYLCPKCDQSEIQLLAKTYFEKNLKDSKNSKVG